MAQSTLTPEQEAVAHKIDTAGLALLGTGVLGGVLSHHGTPGSLVHRAGQAMHSAGPYLDLAGLALIAPPIMHPLARKLAPESPKLPGDAGVPSQEAIDAAEASAAANDAPSLAEPGPSPILAQGYAYSDPRNTDENLKVAACLGELSVRLRYLDVP